jgi:hypothetical protein
MNFIACDTATITTVSIPTQVYTVNDATDTYTFLSWTESIGVCSPFTYTATQVDGSSLPSLYSFDSAS